jgi:hypothetical protein
MNFLINYLWHNVYACIKVTDSFFKSMWPDGYCDDRSPRPPFFSSKDSSFHLLMVDLYSTILHWIYRQDLQILILPIAPESYLCRPEEQKMPAEIFGILSSY